MSATAESASSGDDSALLRLRDLDVTYGRAVRAVRAVSIEVPHGAVVAVLGANGAGKTSLLRAVSGTLPLHGGTVDGGRITVEETALTGRDPAAAVRAGVVQVPEGRRVFAGLTVAENLRAGTLGLRGSGRAARISTALDRVFALFPVLADRRGQRAGLLSGGEQQMLAIGRALMAEPRLLLLDEPSLGLAPRMVSLIAEVITEINRQGVGVLLVEQNAATALRLARHAYVLDVGRVRLAGPAARLAATDEVRRLYLGEAPEAPESSEAAEAGDESASPAPDRPVRTLRRWRR
ncbi:amino acid/amide ABC transporter ATP-binding protein 2, HAAT family [Actinoalloteichus fjordicus]|uniref:Amino acid/amide ABC transporter ATP-binding protein 2, HAAT family n=1 Tax=Actinoalloteichus fjordicus TaxID=1612552 RepID=A0AAC9LBK1_9PSEU|nr:ABC transporter ATP-binding protein [Actinoalloteichus fjordicus]APU14758.1 amino acid/amide ABC transporter ATP-binding protein 2, HAAT family [Actinoalloteichus fjordicus]